MAGTGDDNTTDEFQPLWKEHLLVLSLTGSSEQWTESVLRAFFAHGPVDPDGRERYRVWQTDAKFLGRLPDGPEARPIYSQSDPWFWYSDPEYGISCVFESRDSSVRWIGPMTHRKVSLDEANKKEDEVWETDPQLKIEYHLQGIELRHKTLLNFLRSVGLLPAEPPAPEPSVVSPETKETALGEAGRSAAIEALLIKLEGLELQVCREMQRDPPRKDPKDDWGYSNRIYNVIYKRPPERGEAKTVANYISKHRKLFKIP